MPATSHASVSLALACLFALLGAATHGCGRTIDVGKSGADSYEEPTIAGTGGTIAGSAGDFSLAGGGTTGGSLWGGTTGGTGGASDAGPPSRVESSTLALSECAGSGGALGGGVLGGSGTGGSESCAPGSSVECVGGGRGVRATITPLNCDAGTGFTGDPMRTHRDCSSALDGESGETCEDTFKCTRLGNSGCCLVIASCKVGFRLTRHGVCPSACATPAPDRAATITSCADLAKLWTIDGTPGAWIGTPCVGSFICSAATMTLTQTKVLALEDYYYCMNGAVHMVPFFVAP